VTTLAGVDHLAAFWWFVTERDRILYRRLAAFSEPWTEDPILRDYHFTNVHRWKDPGTQYIVRYVHEQGLVNRLDVLFAVYAYRGLNRQSTFEKFGMPTRDPAVLAAWVEDMEAARKRGVALGSGRHLTYWARMRRALPLLAVDRDTADRVWAARTIPEVVRIMSRAHLDVGPFFGTQIVGDLVTIKPYGLTMDTSVKPPVAGGSRFGLRLVAGTHTSDDLERLAYDERSSYGRKHRNLIDDPRDTQAFDTLLHNQPAELSEPLTPIDLEHCLCEYARYARLVAGDLTRARYLKRDRA